MGPSTSDKHFSMGVAMHFPQNTGNVNCFVTNLSRGQSRMKTRRGGGGEESDDDSDSEANLYARGPLEM